jgi:hypothetical protein
LGVRTLLLYKGWVAEAVYAIQPLSERLFCKLSKKVPEKVPGLFDGYVERLPGLPSAPQSTARQRTKKCWRHGDKSILFDESIAG